MTVLVAYCGLGGLHTVRCGEEGKALGLRLRSVSPLCLGYQELQLPVKLFLCVTDVIKSYFNSLSDLVYFQDMLIYHDNPGVQALYE